MWLIYLCAHTNDINVPIVDILLASGWLALSVGWLTESSWKDTRNSSASAAGRTLLAEGGGGAARHGWNSTSTAGVWTGCRFAKPRHWSSGPGHLQANPGMLHWPAGEHACSGAPVRVDRKATGWRVDGLLICKTRRWPPISKALPRTPPGESPESPSARRHHPQSALPWACPTAWHSQQASLPAVGKRKESERAQAIPPSRGPSGVFREACTAPSPPMLLEHAGASSASKSDSPMLL